MRLGVYYGIGALISLVSFSANAETQVETKISNLMNEVSGVVYNKAKDLPSVTPIMLEKTGRALSNVALGGTEGLAFRSILESHFAGRTKGWEVTLVSGFFLFH